MYEERDEDRINYSLKLFGNPLARITQASRRSKRLDVTIDRGLLDDVRSEARKQGRSIGFVLSRCLELWLTGELDGVTERRRTSRSNHSYHYCFNVPGEYEKVVQSAKKRVGRYRFSLLVRSLLYRYVADPDII